MRKLLAAAILAASCSLAAPAHAAPAAPPSPTAVLQPMTDDEMAHVVGGQINVPPPGGGGSGTPPPSGPPPVDPLVAALQRIEARLQSRGVDLAQFPAVTHLEAALIRFIQNH
jgi:hypothetical protein